MQTFLPYENFVKSASCLDYKRLGKQRIEAWQIYCALTKKNYGWKNHPVVLMWKGYEASLLVYGITICTEWIKRGYKDTMLTRFVRAGCKTLWTGNPPWLGNCAFHNSHKSNLLRKNPKHYKQFNWNVPDNLPYVWNKKEAKE